MVKNERAVKSFEELFAQLKKYNPSFTPATGYEEFMERLNAAAQAKNVNEYKKLNDIWLYFYKYPEIALFEDLRKSLQGLYLAQASKKRIENLEAALETMLNFALSLYDGILKVDAYKKYYLLSTQLTEEDFITKKTRKTSEKGKQPKEGEKPSRLIKKTAVRIGLYSVKFEDYVADSTPIAYFLGQSEGDLKIVKYLKDRNVETLGQFISLCYLNGSNKSKLYRALVGFCRGNSLNQNLANFRIRIKNYVNRQKEMADAENEMLALHYELMHEGENNEKTETEQVEQPSATKQKEENLTEQVEQPIVTKEEISTDLSATEEENSTEPLTDSLPVEAGDPQDIPERNWQDIYDWMKSLEPKFFVQGSAALKKIWKEWYDNRTAEADSYIDAELTEQDVSSWLEDENNQYCRIVDLKREELKLQLEEEAKRRKKEELKAMARKSLRKGEKYHHLPKENEDRHHLNNPFNSI